MTETTQTETQMKSQNTSSAPSEFTFRHIGPSEDDIKAMLKAVGFKTLDEFVSAVVPSHIQTKNKISLGALSNGMSEQEALDRLLSYANENQLFRSFIGMGYYDTATPTVILRNIFENPGWYTQYTPYQPEISQGRLEALLNFQTMVSDLTGLPIASSSLLDEGTAAAEAMAMSYAVCAKTGQKKTFAIDIDCHPQTIAVVETRAKPLGLKVEVVDLFSAKLPEDTFGVLVQYPGSSGTVKDIKPVIEKAHATGAIATVATDLLALTLITPPGELGADIAIGSAQRLGVPLGFGGPHAAFFSTKDEYKRSIPGRIVGVSKDSRGKPALRLALQTREQHIRREKATSNICTAQVLLAVMASMYAVFHGPRRLKEIAQNIHAKTSKLAASLKKAGFKLSSDSFFDTIKIQQLNGSLETILKRAEAKKINLRKFEDGSIGISLDEVATDDDIFTLLEIITGKHEIVSNPQLTITPSLKRTSSFLEHPVFNSYHSETEFLRYVKKLESRDLSLCHSMIPLGSCTMKLNASTEMIPVTYAGFSKLHPFAPASQTKGYQKLFNELEESLCAVTGFSAISLQPNAGSQGEYAGLLVIRAYQESKGEAHRNICLIPKSAHGTNPASAVMAGLTVIAVECDASGNIDVKDLKAKAEQHKANLACIMVTYPSTHGVFEGTIQEISKIIHDNGGQVYLDGANLNALVGIVTPDGVGADVCHINLHKTFCIPHGGGGPGMGPIGVRSHLAPFLPGHPVVKTGGANAIGPISAAPWGSASILPISWAYIAMMGSEGVTFSTKIALLAANYIAKRLEGTFPVLFKGESGFVAHECILDLRAVKASAGIEVDDVAKRLVDYGFHAPTVSWPVAGTVMVEPTESESKKELDRFCDAMLSIREEIKSIESGSMPKDQNALKGAPHTADTVISDSWNRPYSRELAAYPSAFVKDFKFWPAVGRVDASYGDRNLVCACPTVEEIAQG